MVRDARIKYPDPPRDVPFGCQGYSHSLAFCSFRGPDMFAYLPRAAVSYLQESKVLLLSLLQAHDSALKISSSLLWMKFTLVLFLTQTSKKSLEKRNMALWPQWNKRAYKQISTAENNNLPLRHLWRLDGGFLAKKKLKVFQLHISPSNIESVEVEANSFEIEVR